MSINCTQLKSLRTASLGIFIALLSVSSNASESKLNTDVSQKNSVFITVSKQENTIKPLLEKQLNNERNHAMEAKIESLEKALEAIPPETVQPKEENQLKSRLESIESSLSSIANKEKYFTYADLAAVAITCVAVLLTVVGLAIAALAFWGYKEIKELTKNSAAEEAKSVAKRTMEEMINGVAKNELEKLISSGKLREPLQDAVDMSLRSDSNNVDKKRTEELLHELDVFESDLDGSEDDKSFGNDRIRREGKEHDKVI